MKTTRSLILGGLQSAAVLVLLVTTSLGFNSRSCPSPINYCLSSPNSAGPGAVISWTGTPSLPTNDFHLVAAGCPPNQFLMFYYGGAETQVTFGNGWRCVNAGGVGIFRFKPFLIDGTGAAVMKVDFDQPPAGSAGGAGRWLPGDTWYCQGWYRDSAGGGAQFNLTDGLEVPICLDGPYDEMVLVPAGTFEMGDHSGTGFPEELPVHPVSLDAFYMDVYEVTNQEYADYLNTAYAEGRVTVYGGVVSHAAGGELCDTTASSSESSITWNGLTFGVMSGFENLPMIEVSWIGACAYANHRSRLHGLTSCYIEHPSSWACDFSAEGYRLPTEAEWEYAARGGEHNPYYAYPWGDSIDGSMANFLSSGDPYEGVPPETTPVGYYDGNQTPPGVDMSNGYGLYDMSGNVSEWCWDRYDSNYYSYSPPSNPTGPASGSLRLCRGGSWEMPPSLLRLTRRGRTLPWNRYGTIGFRVVATRP